jgi:hypothetical protein
LKQIPSKRLQTRKHLPEKIYEKKKMPAFAQKNIQKWKKSKKQI